jgi:hypothetical protein
MASVSYCLILRIAFVKVIVVRKPLKIIKKEQSFGSKSQPFFPDLSRHFSMDFHGFPGTPVGAGSPLGPPWVPPGSSVRRTKFSSGESSESCGSSDLNWLSSTCDGPVQNPLSNHGHLWDNMGQHNLKWGEAISMIDWHFLLDYQPDIHWKRGTSWTTPWKKHRDWESSTTLVEGSPTTIDSSGF